MSRTLLFSTLIISAMASLSGVRAQSWSKVTARPGYNDVVPKKPNGRCLLIVGGKKKIDGPCLVDVDSDGSFEFNDNRMVLRCAFKGDDCGGAAYLITRRGYFGFLSINVGQPADLSWNEGRYSTAQASLGPVVRAGGCWVGRSPGWPKVKLCVWKTRK